MTATALESTFPLSLTVLSVVATVALLAILFLLIVINSKLSEVSAKLSRTSRPVKAEEKDAPPVVVEAAPGTHFEEFLNEDPERRKLGKKEQFKAYRAWRAEKGLNWSK